MKNRRDFLKSGLVAASAAALGPSLFDVDRLFAQTGPFIRPDVGGLSSSSRIIEGYRRAVTRMRALPSTDRRNWIYQANIHGTTTTPLQQAWRTCQHGSWFFLPWHRMYLYWFERIVRRYSGVSDWALPFWNYTNAAQRQLPSMFRTPTTNNSLYTVNRNSQINGGAQIPASATQYSMAFGFTNFSSAAGSGASFGGQRIAPIHGGSPHSQLESQPHDVIHGLIGGWMGSFATAARDPIFWLHHSNIDRLWNLWLTLGGGRSDPTNMSGWTSPTFTFFNENGNPVTMTACDILRAQAQLGYRYEGEPAQVQPTCPPPPPPGQNLPEPPTAQREILQLPQTQSFSLGTEPATVSLPLRGPAHGAAMAAIATEQRQIVMNLENVQFQPGPGIYYEVYVGLPRGARGDADHPAYVGNLGFFGGDHGEGHDGPGHSASFRIDQAITAAMAGGAAEGDVPVTFVPRGLIPRGQTRETITANVPVRVGRLTMHQE